MQIEIYEGDRRRYLELLLLADEQEDMLLRYLDRGTMFLLRDGEGGEEERVRAVCIVTPEDGGVLELKNLAVDPAFHRRGYGRAMLEFLAGHYRGRYPALLVGTGDSPLTVPFYRACGFSYSHTVKDFFLAYDHPIYECGVRLRDMIYLKRTL